MPTVDQILNDTRAFVKEKQASFRKGAAEEALSNPGSIPGSVHDSNVDASMQNSHPETQQEIPAGSKVRSGATDGEDLESGHATNALEPIPGVTQEPLESADALGGNVGSSTVGDQAHDGTAGALGDESRSTEGTPATHKHPAAKHANDLLSMISQHNAQQKAAAAPAPGTAPAPTKTAAPAAPAPAAPTPAPTKAAACECGKDDCTACNKVAGDTKHAGEIELTQDVLSKIASVILSTEEGWAFAEAQMSKAAGADAARETIQFLEQQALEAEKQAAYAQGQTDADNLIKAAVYEAGRADAAAAASPVAPQAQAGSVVSQLKAAAARYRQQTPATNVKGLQDLGREVAEQAVKQAQDLAAALGGGAPAPEVMPPEAGGEDLDAAAAEMAAPPMEGGGEEDISPEELEQALSMMAQEGTIGPEDVQEILAYLEQAGGAPEMGGAEMGGAEMGAPAPPPPAPAPAAEGGGDEAAEDESGMEAYASANPLVQAIRRVQAKNK